MVEFNCRLGDPETQAVLPLTESSLVEPMVRIAEGGGLGDWEACPAPGAALVTVLASAGYPESSDSGRPIELPDFDPATVRVYHAGTALDGGTLVTAGGRVLAVTGLGNDLSEAARHSREAAERIDFQGAQWRRDIGWHELSPDPAAGPSAPAVPGA